MTKVTLQQWTRSHWHWLKLILNIDIDSIDTRTKIRVAKLHKYSKWTTTQSNDCEFTVISIGQLRLRWNAFADRWQVTRTISRSLTWSSKTATRSKRKKLWSRCFAPWKYCIKFHIKSALNTYNVIQTESAETGFYLLSLIWMNCVRKRMCVSQSTKRTFQGKNVAVSHIKAKNYCQFKLSITDG